MLLKDFYTINSLKQASPQQHEAFVLVNENHEIFKGHFPGNPIMPGVCMMQIIKELTEGITKSDLVVQSLSNVKFMALINPFATPELRFDLDITEDGDLIKVKNTSCFNETVALKLSIVYKKISL
ncbi:3-hydroxyacyl-ACP dehydratase [Flavobacterium sp. 3HN19-14]|uniref:3-hydroxyacyl-ACP dehydratase n=1 Tax=Flavobacterium sp. 3HN19-14 TaxID=3448133 RepID=UPI003EE289B8